MPAVCSSPPDITWLTKSGDVHKTPTQHLYDLFFNPFMLPEAKLNQVNETARKDNAKTSTKAPMQHIQPAGKTIVRL
jgi:hypothetical protein